MSGLQANAVVHLGKARVERHQLHFDPGLLLLVGKGLPHAERRQIGGIWQANLVVPVVVAPARSPDGIDRAESGPRSNSPCRFWPALPTTGTTRLGLADPADLTTLGVRQTFTNKDRRPGRSAVDAVQRAPCRVTTAFGLQPDTGTTAPEARTIQARSSMGWWDPNRNTA